MYITYKVFGPYTKLFCSQNSLCSFILKESTSFPPIYMVWDQNTKVKGVPIRK